MNWLIAQFQANLGITEPPLAGVYYGMDELVPTFPAICVVGGQKERLVEETQRVGLNIRVDVLVVHQMIQSNELTRQQVDHQAEAVEDFLIANPNASGNVVFATVTRVDPGQAAFGDTMTQASRLRWEAISRQDLVM
jgi:hypothetical protein